MTLVMRCEEKERLVGYLYDEVSAAERAAVEAHLSRCAACAAELDDLKAVRVHLAGWNAPEADLGFHITRGPAAVAPQGRSWSLPAWAQAAAAVLVLGAGAGLANLQVHYGSDGFTVGTGRRNPPPTATRAMRAMPTAEGFAPGTVTAADLTALEQRLRAEFAATPSAEPAAARTPAVNARDLLPQVRALLDERDARQRQELALRLADVVRDLDVQRRADLVRIDQSMRQIEGVTGEQAVGQREMMNYLMRVSQRR